MNYLVVGILGAIALASSALFFVGSDAAPVFPKFSELPPGPVTNSQASVYIARKGDSISSISALFGASSNAILWTNHLLNASTIQAGQTLVIGPVSGVIYVVRNGDTLASIAQRFGVSAAGILTFNDLDDGSLKVGSKIIIPNSAQ